MPIDCKFKNSGVYKLLAWLFVNNDNRLFQRSKILKLLDKITNTKLSLACLSLSVICLWYEGFFADIGFHAIENYNLGAVFLILSLIFCNKQRIRSTRAVIYLLLFILSLLISGLYAAITGLEAGMIINGILVLSQFAIAFITASTYLSKITFVNMILIVSLPLLIVGIFQGFWGETTSRLWVSETENLVSTRAFGFFGSPNVLGSLSMTTAIMALFTFLDRKKWYYLAYELLALAVLTLTFSRSAWLGLAVGVATILLIRNWKLLLLTPLGLLVLLIPSIRQRLLVITSRNYLVDAAIDGRIWSLTNAIEIFRISPIFGTGPGSYGGQTAVYYNSPIYLKSIQNGYVTLPYTDNQWLQILVQSGVVGTVCVAGFFISLFVNNLKRYMSSKHYMNLGVIAVLVAIAVNGLMSNVWEFGAIAVLSGAYLGLGNI
jgi:O-antigen ligase